MRWCLILFLAVLLAACESQTRLAVNSLDAQHPGGATEVCQQATRLAPLHDEIKLSRVLGSPVVLLASGGTALVPVLLANMGLDALDRMDASHVNVSCGHEATPAQNIAERVILGAGFNLFTGAIKPIGN